jgi:hypothetical protein
MIRPKRKKKKAPVPPHQAVMNSNVMGKPQSFYPNQQVMHTPQQQLLIPD